MGDLAIEAIGLVKRYGRKKAVNGLDLTVREGSIYCLLGRNGSGKSTTIRLLLGLVHADLGSARVLGFDCKREHLKILSRTGFVGDRPLLSSLTGQDLVRFNKGFYPQWSDSLAKRYAEVFQLSLQEKYKMMSRGNQTKLALTLALAQRPDLLVLDEPTAGLDPIVTDELLRILVEDFASEGRTVFLSTHHIAEVEKIADWVGIIEEGRLLLESRTEDLRTEVRRISVLGEISGKNDESVISSRHADGTTEFVLRNNATAFAAYLKANGATVLHSAPMNLSEVFLEFVRKEGPCISGNAGAIPA